MSPIPSLTLYLQVDSLLDQAGASHWAARVEALEGLLGILTVEGNGEGGKFVLEHKTAARRLESVIIGRFGDAHFRVSYAALRLFGGIVKAHPSPFACHVTSLLPSVGFVVQSRIQTRLELNGFSPKFCIQYFMDFWNQARTPLKTSCVVF